jgi:hypothetical protein
MRRSILILSLLIIAIIVPVGVMAQEGEQTQVAVQELPPEEYIPEGDPTPPSQFVVQEPELVVVPSGNTEVYMVPNTPGVYFHGGRWYRHHHGVWFGADSYNAPWVIIAPAVVPSFVVDISPAYALYLPPSYHRIHYRDFHSNWRTWDRERHWNRYDWYKNERRADIRRDRMHRANVRMTRDRRERHERVKADPVGHRNRLANPARYNKPGHVGPQKPGQQGGIHRPQVQQRQQQPRPQVQQRQQQPRPQVQQRQQQPRPQVQQRQQQQPKPQVQQRQQQPRPQVQQRQQQQPKPQVQQRQQQKPRDDKQNVR